MKNPLSLLKKQGRTTVMTVISVLVLLAAFLLGIGANAVKLSLNSYIDETKEGLYTLTDAFLEEVGQIEDEITITFCADPDVLLNNYETRYIYIMAREIERSMDNVKVVTCDVARNPTAVQQYRTTSTTVIRWNHVIVSCEKRYRMLTAAAFWSTDSTTGTYFAFNGEYKMATAMLSITAVKRPVAYFTVGHGEQVYDPTVTGDAENEERRAFWQLLQDEGLAVETLDLETSEIPSDCVLLIMNGPTVDYADGDWYHVNEKSTIEKIDRYMDNAGSLMIFKDPDATLPTLEEYLQEWGIVYHNDVTIKDPRASASDDTGVEDARDRLVAVYPNSTDHALGYSLFGDVAGLTSAPRMIIEKSGYITSSWIDNGKYFSNEVSAMTSPVFLSSENARAYDAGGAIADDSGSYSLVQVTTRVHSRDVRDYYSYVFCAATTAITSTTYLDNPTYANYDVLFAAIRSISRTDEYASDALGGLNMNSKNYGGKRLHSEKISGTPDEVYKDGKLVRTYLGLTLTSALVWVVLISLPPITFAVLGVVRCVRRKNR